MKRITLFLGTLLILISCSKEKQQRLLTGTWVISNYEVKSDLSPQWTQSTESCHFDNVEEFDKDGDYTLYDGTDMCNSSEIIYGTWELAASNTKIIFTYDFASGEYESDIVKLTKDEMILTWGSGLSTGEQFRATYYKR